MNNNRKEAPHVRTYASSHMTNCSLNLMVYYDNTGAGYIIKLFLVDVFRIRTYPPVKAAPFAIVIMY